MRGLFALCLATASPQPAYSFESPKQEIVDQDEYLRQAMIQSIFERLGIEIIADYDPQITNMLREHSPNLFTSANYSPTLEMVQTVDWVLNKIPAAGFMTQKIIFFEPPRNISFVGGFLHNISEEGWIILYHNPNILLSHPYWGSPSTLNIPDYGTLMAQTLVHELGHGFHSNVLFLQSYDLGKYTKDWESKYLNPEDPILRTYAKVAGFEFVESEESEKTIRFQRRPFFSAIFTRNLDGWVRTEKSLLQRQISEYAKWSTIAEAFAEDFKGNLFNPSFYSQEMQEYFQNIFNGIDSAEDPGYFLLSIAQNPEELLLK